MAVSFIHFSACSGSISFALDSWYKDYRSDIARLQGRWVCESTVHSEGASIVIEGCRVQNNNGSNKQVLHRLARHGRSVSAKRFS
jgi:hypothetical protein